MVKKGELIQVDSDRYAMPQAKVGKNMAVGRLTMHRDGYGFVIPETSSLDEKLKARLSGDVFIPPPAIGSAMHGDRVLVELGPIRPDGRAEGRIVRVVGRVHNTVVGTFHYGNRYNYVRPIDEKITQDVVIPPGMEFPEKLTVESTDKKGSKKGKRSLHRVLGDEAAQRTEWDHLDNGNYELQVYIADGAHYVTRDTGLDQEARLRGTSVYFPDRAVPMLPLELSTDICSLRPHQDRLVMSCVMEIDHQGEVIGYEISEGVIRSAERMTYTDVNLCLEGDLGARKRYAHLVDQFELMRELETILNRKRQRRGSIDFDLPEPVIEFDEHGLMKSITRSERNIAHRIIEEFMLSANESVAQYLEK